MGCNDGDSNGAHDWAILSTKELGIPVNLWALPSDACAIAQMQKFAEGYQKLDPKKRLEKKALLAKKYRSITVHGTRDLGRMNGSRIDVQLERNLCEWHVRPMREGQDSRYQECELKVVASLGAQDTRKLDSGAVPGTMSKSEVEAESGKVDLKIQPLSASNYSYEGLLRTEKTDAFARAVKRQPGHEEDLRAGRVKIVNERQNNGGLFCGRLMTFEEIL